MTRKPPAPLQLVGTPPAPQLRSVALVDIEPELGGYLAQRLRTRWPGSEIRRIKTDGELTRDPPQLCIRTREPERPSTQLTLWLAAIDRSRSTLKLAPNLWRSATPVTGRRLVRIVEDILRASECAADESG